MIVHRLFFCAFFASAGDFLPGLRHEWSTCCREINPAEDIIGLMSSKVFKRKKYKCRGW